MKTVVTAAAATALLAATACTPVIEGGPPIALPIGLQQTAQVSSITLSTGWLDAEEDFSDEQAFGRNPRDRGLHNATGG